MARRITINRTLKRAQINNNNVIEMVLKRVNVTSQDAIILLKSCEQELISYWNQANLESFKRSFDEARDGSEGPRHMHREGDGKFGSFPLHDDYSDEADA